MKQKKKIQPRLKTWLVILISILVITFLIGGLVFLAMDRQNKTRLNKLEKGTEKNQKLNSGIKNDESVIKSPGIADWTLISHENFWNNQNFFKNDNYNFPNVKFYYPSNWFFKCCGDMEHASEHYIFSSEAREKNLPYIRITNFVLRGCSNLKETCSLNEMKKITVEQKFNAIQSQVPKEEILPKIKSKNLDAEIFVFKNKEQNGKFSKAYLINSGDGVIEIDFINYDLLNENFIEEFLNKLSLDNN